MSMVVVVVSMAGPLCGAVGGGDGCIGAPVNRLEPFARISWRQPFRMLEGIPRWGQPSNLGVAQGAQHADHLVAVDGPSQGRQGGQQGLAVALRRQPAVDRKSVV